MAQKSMGQQGETCMAARQGLYSQHHSTNGKILPPCPGGGVGLIVTNRWANRVMASGSNPLGRWVGVTLRGKRREKLTIV